jgi:glycosyltransferase involved in cell wall biosynthesis
VQLALDVTPLAGTRTGVGRMVEAFDERLGHRLDVDVVRYVTGRATVPGAIRSQLPGSWAVRLWARGVRTPIHPRLRNCAVVHGTNFVAPGGLKHLVLTVHDPTPLTHPEWCEPAIGSFGEVVRRRSAEGAWLHAPTQAVADVLERELHSTRVRAIHHGPPPSLTGAPTRPQPRPYFVAIGTRERRKNLPRLLRAFHDATSELPEHDLVLIGTPGNDTVAIANTIASMPVAIQRRIMLLAHITDGDKATWLRHADALVYPSLDEGFGFPMLEAFAAGVPVMASNVAALSEIAGVAAVLIDPHSETSMTSGLITVASDSEVRAKLQAAGRDRLAQFSWQRATDELMELYRDVLVH